jgi:hypothetical protein
MPKLQRDTWSKFGNEVGEELNLLFSAAASLGITPSPNTRTKQTSTGTVLEFVNREGAKATTETTPEVTEQWFKLVTPETGKPTGYKLPEVGTNPKGDWYGNRAGLKVHLWHEGEHGWSSYFPNTAITRDYIQIFEVAGLGLPCDKDGNLISGREEEYTWIAPPPIPLNCLNPIIWNANYSGAYIYDWLNGVQWGKPIYKYGDTLAECTRDNDAFYQHTNYSTGNISTHLYYPCYNELYGNWTYAEVTAGWTGDLVGSKKLMPMFGWEYWYSLFMDAYIGGVGSMSQYPPNVTRGYKFGGQPTNIIKALKLPSPIKFGSQNAATEVIECSWMDSNEAGRVWTATNNYLEGLPKTNLLWDAAFPDLPQYKEIALFTQSNEEHYGAIVPYYLHNRHRASNLIRSMGRVI